MNTNIEDFKKAVEAHDLTFMYSDDYSAYTRGNNSLSRIKHMASQLPKEEALKIWNEAVEKKVVESVWDEFKWTN